MTQTRTAELEARITELRARRKELSEELRKVDYDLERSITELGYQRKSVTGSIFERPPVATTIAKLPPPIVTRPLKLIPDTRGTAFDEEQFRKDYMRESGPGGPR